MFAQNPVLCKVYSELWAAAQERTARGQGCMHVEAGEWCIKQVGGRLLHVRRKRSATEAEDCGSSLAI